MLCQVFILSSVQDFPFKKTFENHFSSLEGVIIKPVAFWRNLKPPKKKKKKTFHQKIRNNEGYIKAVILRKKTLL